MAKEALVLLLLNTNVYHQETGSVGLFIVWASPAMLVSLGLS